MSQQEPIPTTLQPVGPSAALLAILTSALWGATPVAISFSVDSGLPPVAVAGLRFTLGALFMLVWCWCSRTPILLQRGQVRLAVIAGVLLFVQISLFNMGVARSNSSHGTMHINTFIFWVVAIEHFVTKTDRISTRKLLGLVTAAIGVAVVLLATTETPENASGDQPSLSGDLLLLLSALVLGVKIVFTKHALKKVDPGTFVLWHDVIGVALFATYSFAFEDLAPARLTTEAILAVVYQGIVVAGFCFAVQTALLRRHSASQISVFSFSTPLFGVTFAVLFRGDYLSPWLLVSAVCIATGILLVNWPRRDQ